MRLPLPFVHNFCCDISTKIVIDYYQKNEKYCLSNICLFVNLNVWYIKSLKRLKRIKMVLWIKWTGVGYKAGEG